jgi:hypothetical protein
MGLRGLGVTSREPSMNSRRRFLRAAIAGAATGLAGCSGLGSRPRSANGTVTDARTQPETDPETDTPDPTTDADRTATERASIDELTYYSPAADLRNYGELVRTRKRAALRSVLSVPAAAQSVLGAVSSTAYHRIFEGIDFVEILAPHEMEVVASGTGDEPGLDDPTAIAEEYVIRYRDVARIRGLVDRETDELLRVEFGEHEPHTITWNYDELGIDLTPARISLEDPRVRDVLADVDWYVAASGRSVYAGYSEEYPIDSLSLAWFNWNDRQGEFVSLHTVLDADRREVLGAYTPRRSTPQPLTAVVADVRGEPEPAGFDRGPIEPPGEFGLVDRGEGVVEAHGWRVAWRDTLHDAYAVEATYKGKPVFGPQTQIPYMFSDYEPFGTVDPGVPLGEDVNHHFWDPLGVTGPGVVERHDFAEGFRIRGTFHSGSSTRWEWRFGQNYGPYRYVIDWSFFADGTAILTSRHPTTGYRTTNGYPEYTYHVSVQPGFERASASAYDGEEWTSVEEEAAFERAAMPRLRIENADGPERLVFERPGETSYLLQYDPELSNFEQTAAGLRNKLLDHQEYLEPENYLRGRSLDGEPLQARLFSQQDTGAGPYATVDPFVFSFVMRAENY